MQCPFSGPPWNLLHHLPPFHIPPPPVMLPTANHSPIPSTNVPFAQTSHNMLHRPKKPLSLKRGRNVTLRPETKQTFLFPNNLSSHQHDLQHPTLHPSHTLINQANGIQHPFPITPSSEQPPPLIITPTMPPQPWDTKASAITLILQLLAQLQ